VCVFAGKNPLDNHHHHKHHHNHHNHHQQLQTSQQQQQQQYIINNNRTAAISTTTTTTTSDLNNSNGTNHHNAMLMNNKIDYNSLTNHNNNKMYHHINGGNNNNNNNNLLCNNQNAVSKSVIRNYDKSTLDYKNNKNLILNQHQNNNNNHKIDMNGYHQQYEKHLNGINQLHRNERLHNKRFIITGSSNGGSEKEKFSKYAGNSHDDDSSHSSSSRDGSPNVLDNIPPHVNIHKVNGHLNGFFSSNGHSKTTVKVTEIAAAVAIENGMESTTNGHSNGRSSNGSSFVRNCSHTTAAAATATAIAAATNGRSNDFSTIKINYVSRQTVRGPAAAATAVTATNGYVTTNGGHAATNGHNFNGTTITTTSLHDKPKTNIPSIPNIVINGSASSVNAGSDTVDKVATDDDAHLQLLGKLSFLYSLLLVLLFCFSLPKPLRALSSLSMTAISLLRFSHSFHDFAFHFISPDCTDTENEDKRLLLQLKREQTVKDLTQKLSNLPLSPQEEKPNRIVGTDMSGLISKAKEELAKSKNKSDVKANIDSNDLKAKLEPKKSEIELHWEELMRNLDRDLILCDLNFTDLTEEDEANVLVLRGAFGSSIPPPPPPSMNGNNPVPPPMQRSGYLNGNATTPQSDELTSKKTKKTVSNSLPRIRRHLSIKILN